MKKLIFISLVILVGFSCASPTWKSGQNNVSVFLSIPLSRSTSTESGRFLVPINDTVGSSQTVSVSISGADFETQSQTGIPDSSGDVTFTFQIPAGDDRTITAESRSSSGTIISQGQSTNSILPGANSISLSLLPVENPTLFNAYTVPAGGVIIASLTFTAADIAANLIQTRVYFGSSSLTTTDYMYFVDQNGNTVFSSNLAAIQLSGYVSRYFNISVGTYYLIITSQSSINFYSYPIFAKYNPLS